jgi:endonuclease/exonuclease/phosphatase (EEP) superfamily protein YafD
VNDAHSAEAGTASAPAPAATPAPSPGPTGAPSRRSSPRLVAVGTVRHLTYALLAALVLAGLGLTLAGLAGRQSWLAELTTHFRMQLGLGLGAIGLMLGLARSTALATAALVGGALNMMVLLPHYLPVSDPSATDARPLRVLLANVDHTSGEHAAAVSVVLKERPDVAVLLEITDEWLAGIEPLRADYPGWFAVAREDAYGLALIARVPIRTADMVALGELALPAIVAELEVGAAALSLVAAHLPPPLRASAATERNRQIHELAIAARSRSAPLVLCADLNSSPWSPYFGDLADGAGLRDASRGFGLHPTWPAAWPRLLMIPIDHCLVSPDVGVRGVRRGPKTGSDHLPLLVDLAVPQR